MTTLLLYRLAKVADPGFRLRVMSGGGGWGGWLGAVVAFAYKNIIWIKNLVS